MRISLPRSAFFILLLTSNTYVMRNVNVKRINVTFQANMAETLLPSSTFVETNMIIAAATYWYVLYWKKGL